MQQNNNTVFAVSFKNAKSNQTFLGISQASPNQTFVEQPQARNAKKNAIPTKIIKACSLIRGAPATKIMNVLKRHQGDSAVPQQTLKNNYMPNTSDARLAAQESTGVPPRQPSEGPGARNTAIKGQSKTGLSELQLKVLNLPLKDRVQSAKSSSTNQNQSGNSHKKVSLGRCINNGAQSHRESQRYFSRPQDDIGQHATSQPGQKVAIKHSIDRPRSTQNKQPASKGDKCAKEAIQLAAAQQDRSNSKQSVAHQSQGSRERKRSKQVVGDSQSKESRRSGARYSNSSTRAKANG